MTGAEVSGTDGSVPPVMGLENVGICGAASGALAPGTADRVTGGSAMDGRPGAGRRLGVGAIGAAAPSRSAGSNAPAEVDPLVVPYRSAAEPETICGLRPGSALFDDGAIVAVAAGETPGTSDGTTI